MKTVTIIDTFGFFFRSYFALPPLKNSEGFPTGLLTGFINLIDNLHRDHSTDYIVFALDSKGKTFRNDLFSEYKAHRPPAPEDLVKQLPIAIEWIEKMGFANLSEDLYEADDIITTVTRLAKEKGMKVRIVSHDKDLYQLIDDGKVVMVDTVKKHDVTEEECIAKFGVRPTDFTNFQAIVGDTSDNIPGVKGIGIKGAAKLINEFGTLENLYDNIDKAGTPRIQNLLLEYKDSAFMSRELVTMRSDVYDDIDFERFRFEEKNYLRCLAEEFERYEMRQALKKALNGDESKKIAPASKPAPAAATLTFEAVTLDTREKLFGIVGEITPETLVAFDTETTGLDTRSADMVGFSFALANDKAYYVPVAHSYLGVGDQVSLADALYAIRQLFAAKIVGQNLKFDLSLLYNRYGFEPLIPEGDTMILAWLINPGHKVGLDTLAKRYFNYEMKPFSALVKKGEDFSCVDIGEASFYAAEDAWMTRLLYLSLSKTIREQGFEHLIDEAHRIEYPFINTLIGMESVGIKVDQKRLKELEHTLSHTLESLTAEIYELAGTQFNIKSTQQLGVILFETLGLKGGKKTKSGYSTDESVLTSLAHEHPVIDRILEYRAHQKILSTYITPLLKLAKHDEHSRIYTSFLQTGTATGRLSSKDPNLQNIPVRTELGRSVREAFIAKEGHKLMSIDYSQIELRLLAHYSGDAVLIQAFKEGHDIHLATATKLFGEEQAREKRNFAKSVNFGLLYGMGSRKLSDELGITTAEAKSIIESYFASFPTVKRFLEEVQERARIQGYVETISGRRRIFDYESANAMQKAAFQRESVNTIFQGTAADLIKMAMLEINRAAIDGVTMLLQIHDELIFEVREDAVEAARIRLREIMENIVELGVPLECSVSVGDNWGELK